MAQRRTYSDEMLAEAVATSHSWRGVLRALGLAATSASALRSVRARADRLGLDHRHFTGQRRWRDDDLRDAVHAADSWLAVVEALGLSGGSAVASVKGHATRLQLETAHLEPTSRRVLTTDLRPRADCLGRAGSLLAAAWYTLCGEDVSWPLEPSRYDLVVQRGDRMCRVQVKTTTVRVRGTWKVYLSTSRGGRRTYDPDEVDEFFVIDGDMAYYLIPVAVVGGLQAIHLSAYADYRVVQLRGE